MTVLSLETERVFQKWAKSGCASVKAKVGDLATVCVDRDADIWLCVEVGAVDDDGSVMGILAGDGRLGSLHRVARREEVFVTPRSDFVADGVANLACRTFTGVMGVTNEARKWLDPDRPVPKGRRR